MVRMISLFILSMIVTTLSIDYRPQYHVMPLMNWMNDPNGPLFFKGYYHLFYQYNPDAPVWNNMHWGHVISQDLVHWTHLPVALSPDQPYDSAGVFSGSATVIDGAPVIFYTGQLGNNSETQCIAIPQDVTDTRLTNWKKPTYNPVVDKPPSQGNPKEFRDPSTAWQDGNVWHAVVGTQFNSNGATLVYTLQDISNWSFKGILYTSSQWGPAWECPDFFSISNTHVLKISAESYGDLWMIGNYDNVKSTFSPVGDTVPVCYGKFYASKSFHDPTKERQILWAWIAEEDNDGPARGWQGVQSLPTTISIDDVFHIPTTTPIEELNVLRGTHWNYNFNLLPNKVITLDDAQTIQGEILVVFSLTGTTQEGSFGVRIFDNGTHYIEILYNITKDGTQLLLNRDNSGSTGSLSPQGGNISLLPSDFSKLSLHIFIDHSMIEVFGHSGRARITSRVYIPTQNFGISLTSHYANPVSVVNIDVWELGGINY